MTGPDLKAELHSYLRGARETLVWKLDGLGEYDARRPMAPTGTNLLGLVKHNTATNLRYFGDVFGRAVDISPRRTVDGPNPEFLVTADETRDDVITSFKRSWDFADETVAELPLDAIGSVPWWGDATVTLGGVLVHVVAETQRHAGHADIIRETRRLGPRSSTGSTRKHVAPASSGAGAARDAPMADRSAPPVTRVIERAFGVP